MLSKLTGFATRYVTETRNADKEGVGSGRAVGNKTYRWMKNQTTAATVSGGCYTGGTANTLGFFAEAFTFGQSTKGTSVNGPIFVAAAVIAAADYGWFQVGGEVAAQVGGVTGSNVVAFDNLKPVSGQTYLTLDTAAGTAPTARGRAMALAGGNSNGTNVNITLPALAM